MRINKELDEKTKELIKKAFATCGISDSEFRYVVTNILLGENPLLNWGTTQNQNAEIVLRLEKKVKALRKAFWR